MTHKSLLSFTEKKNSSQLSNYGRLIFKAVGAVCRQAGHRFGDHVERVVPLVLKYAKQDDEELREHCLQVSIPNYH